MLFREEAVRHHARRREEAVLPRLVRPRTFALLWVIAALLVATGAGAWFTKIPMYASGKATVARVGGAGGEPVMVLLVPSESLARLKPGQTALIRGESASDSQVRRVTAVLPAPLGPDDVRRRYALTGAAAALATRPVAVALTGFRPPSDGPGAAVYVGSVFSVSVEVGSRRLATLIPGLDRYIDS